MTNPLFSRISSFVEPIFIIYLHLDKSEDTITKYDWNTLVVSKPYSKRLNKILRDLTLGITRNNLLQEAGNLKYRLILTYYFNWTISEPSFWMRTTNKTTQDWLRLSKYNLLLKNTLTTSLGSISNYSPSINIVNFVKQMYWNDFIPSYNMLKEVCKFLLDNLLVT